MMSASSSADPVGHVLVIEAATSAGSVALLHRAADQDAWTLLASEAVAMGSGRVDQLTPAVTALCERSGVVLSTLSAVVCGGGPGSFTSLRIASALAKGLAFGLGVPLYAVPSLLLAASVATDTPPPAGQVLIILDALRDEVYAQRVRIDAAGAAQLDGDLQRVARTDVALLAGSARLVEVDPAHGNAPQAAAARWCVPWERFGPLNLDGWEPEYGRLAEAQVKWEAAQGRPLPAR